MPSPRPRPILPVRPRLPTVEEPAAAADLPMFPLGGPPEAPSDTAYFARPGPRRQDPIPMEPSFAIHGPVMFTPPVVATPLPDIAGERRRADAWRVFAVLTVLFAALSSVAVGTVLLLVTFAPMPPPPEAPPILVVQTPDDEPEIVAPPPPPPVRTVTVVRPPPPPVGPASVVVHLAPGSPPFQSFSVTCDGGAFRKQAFFADGTATVPDVPRTDCVLHFRGVGALPQTRVTGGEQLTCGFVGNTPDCRRDPG